MSVKDGPRAQVPGSNRVAAAARAVAVLVLLHGWCAPADAQEYQEHYANEFEAEDDATFWNCGQPQVFGLDKATENGYLTVNSKGLSAEEAYSGERSLRLDVTFHDKGGKFTIASWRGPILKTPLTQPVFLSGRVFAPDLPEGIQVGFGWSIRGTSPRGDFTQTSWLMPLVKSERGWLLFEENVSDKVHRLGWGEDSYLDHWVLFVRAKTPFKGQRVVIYLDEVRAASSPGGPAAGPKLVFSDDFERDDVGEDWRSLHGAWTIKDRALYVVGPGTIACTKPVGPDMRIEYDCIADDPADLSAVLGIPPEDWVRQGYFFGFGASANTRNKILRRGQEIHSDTRHLPRPRQWHHVVIEKRGRHLRMLVDGQASLDTFDTQPLHDGDHFGLYVWGTGKFDNVRAYAIPPGEAKDEEPAAVVRHYTGFEGDAPGEPPAGFEVQAGEGASVSVLDLPNWTEGQGAKQTLADRCVRLEDNGGGAAEMRLTFTPVNSGFIEMDLMAGSYSGKPLRIALLGADGQELAALFVDEFGTLCADQGESAALQFEHAPDFFRWKGMKERVCLRPERWFTLRLGFDCDKARFYVALLNYYALVGSTAGPDFLGHWMELGNRIPFLRSGQPVAAVAIRTVDQTTLYVDNFFAYGPVHPFLVNGMDYRFPAKRLLGVKYEDRRDPLTLRNYSLRHVLPRARPCLSYDHMRERASEFVEAGIEYSSLLVRQGFVHEDMQTLERVAFYLESAQKLSTEARKRVSTLAREVAETEQMLDALYRAFAAAYLDSRNEAGLQRTFPQPAADLAARLDDVGDKVKAALEDFAALAPASAPAVEPAAAGGSASDYRWAKEKGCLMKGDQPAYLHPSASWGDWFKMGDFGRLLDLPGCTRTDRKTHECKPGEYSDYQRFSGYESYIANRPDATFMHSLSLGPHDLWIHGPAWWFERHGSDTDIYVQDRDGKIVAMPADKKWYEVDRYGGPTAHLNWWHPLVQQFFRDAGRDISRFLRAEYPGRTKVFVWGGEEIHSVYNNETGHNPSARAAFREYLKREYGDIADLNARWGTTYGSFEEIDTPGNEDRPTGLQYEFARFRNEGYFDMMRAVARGLREHCPEVPMCGYLNLNHGGNDRRVGFDLPGMFETLDIFTYHTYRPRSWQPMNRCMDSLRKAYPDTALGVLEWGAALVNNPQLCDEECYKANGLAMLFDSMAWGQSLHDLWRGIGTGAAAGDNWPEPRLGNTVLRYSTTHMPLSMARIRRVGRVALEYPTVQPDVAILEVTSSFFDALPTSLYYLGPRLWMGEIAAALEEEGWNYGYLWERLVLEGKQSVQGIQTIVVPLGYCCPPELAEKLIAWVRDGGRLILVGPCGIYNQYGRPDNRLLSAAFGDADWTQQTARSWTPSSPDERPSNEEAGVYQAALGRGTVLLFGDLDDPFPMDELMRAVAANTRSTIHCTNPEFKLVLREAPDAYYLYVVNTDARPLEGASQGEVTLTRAISEAADLGVHKPVSVPLTQVQDRTHFTIRLAQGEGTLVRLTR